MLAHKGRQGKSMFDRDVDEAALVAYERDGVVCLRNIFGPEWLAAIAEGIEADCRAPGRFFRDQTPEGSPAKYLFSFWAWQNLPSFHRVIFDSPAGEIAGRLMRAEAATMIMDNWFLREAGATNGAPWHHDEPYFDFAGGRMCSVWIPLESVTAEEGLTFVAGSHRWGKLFMPLYFRDRVPYDGVAEDTAYAPVPDIDAAPERYRLVSWDMNQGDCLVFDLRSLHGATAGTRPLQRTIRRLSLRFGDEQVRFKPRGVWTEEITQFLIEQGQAVGETLNCRILPVAWRRAS
jgi:ectoine hydroxylase-related dioxygenase (phytanoyl-CoA dioxygenase family)